MRKDDPYYDLKVYHKAGKMNAAGEVSALCYKRPRPIPLSRGQNWTFVAENVTCTRCRKLLREIHRPDEPGYPCDCGRPYEHRDGCNAARPRP